MHGKSEVMLSEKGVSVLLPFATTYCAQQHFLPLLRQVQTNSYRVDIYHDLRLFVTQLPCLGRLERGHYKMSAVICPSVRLSVHLSVACFRPNSRTERPSKAKFSRIEGYRMINPCTYLEVKGQRSKVRITRLINALPKVRHFCRKRRSTKSKLGTHMENGDPYHRQAPLPPRSKVKDAISRGASDRC